MLPFSNICAIIIGSIIGLVFIFLVFALMKETKGQEGYYRTRTVAIGTQRVFMLKCLSNGGEVRKERRYDKENVNVYMFCIAVRKNDSIAIDQIEFNYRRE